jgi:hypothetical protein
MSPVSALALPSTRSRPTRASLTSLPHWSEARTDPLPLARPAPHVAAVLHDLVSWAADLAIVLTREYPEDREAIDRVRRCAFAWLSGEPCPEVSIDDVLLTAATLMASIDHTLGGTVDPDKDERHAVGGAAA